MRELLFDFDKNVEIMDTELNIKENFDIIKREMLINNQRIAMYYVDGFVTAAIMQKLIMHLTTIKDFGSGKEGDVIRFTKTSIPAVEVDPVYDFDSIIKMVLSGCSAIYSTTF